MKKKTMKVLSWQLIDLIFLLVRRWPVVPEVCCRPRELVLGLDLDVVDVLGLQTVRSGRNGGVWERGRIRMVWKPERLLEELIVDVDPHRRRRRRRRWRWWRHHRRRWRRRHRLETFCQRRVGGRQNFDQASLFQLQVLDFRFKMLVSIFKFFALLKIKSAVFNWPYVW